ncbi:hypothetical protein [Deinococcus sp. 12RED42]|uniref:hypothetical protein n=1 Tax=Deinococcus sp. 12RED42 TaxID=2745872 RepID=UPI001E4EDEE6|nr:hypothetical protein [Deinococcus sp. 12RED42]MCD0165263.1 hypothetical protein [Deinococcus sp. 12RED42]
MSGPGPESLPWTLPLTRAHRRVLNVLPIRHPHADPVDLEVVHVTPDALVALRAALARPVPATGVLFGLRAGGQAQPGSDWVGGWITAPDGDGLAPGALDALARQAATAGLTDHDAPLLVAGWIDGHLTLQAVTLSFGRVLVFPVTTGNGTP